MRSGPGAAAMEWRAQPRQRDFLVRREDEVLYGGAAGGGKTDALLICGIRTCVTHSGAKVLFLRRTFADLSKPGAAIDRSRELLTGRAAWNGGDHRWTFANGSVLQFGHLQNPGDEYAYQGAQFDCLLWDELTQFTSAQYSFLRSRVRATVPGLVPVIRAATNPGGIGHQWVRERWIDAGPWGQPFALRDLDSDAGTRPGTGCFIPARVADNAALLRRDPAYPERLRALPGELRRAYLDGDWDLFAGQFFSLWRRALHVVEPCPIPAAWTERRVGVDFGYGAPWCALWFVRDEDLWRRERIARWYAYREFYASGVRDVDQAHRMRAAVVSDLLAAPLARIRIWADPSMWNRTPSGTSVADTYRLAKVPLIAANNDRLNGWQLCQQWLAPQRDGRPGIVFFSTCTNAIRTIPALVHDATRVEDVDTEGDDHAGDALRYFTMSLGPVAGGLAPRDEGTRTPYLLHAGDPTLVGQRGDLAAAGGAAPALPAASRSLWAELTEPASSR